LIIGLQEEFPQASITMTLPQRESIKIHQNGVKTKGGMYSREQKRPEVSSGDVLRCQGVKVLMSGPN
jgi:hypothetical protein